MSDTPTRPDSGEMDLNDLTEDLGPLADHDLPTRRMMRVDDPDFLALTRRAEVVEPHGGAEPLSTPEPLPEHTDSWRQMVEHIPPRTYHNVPTSPAPPPVPPPTAPNNPTRAPSGSGSASPPRKRRRTARERRESGWYLPWWSLLVMLGVVVFFATLLLLGLNLLGGGAAPGGETPQVIVVTGETEVPPPQRPTSTPLQMVPAGGTTSLPPDTDLSLLASPTIPGDVTLPTPGSSPAAAEVASPPAGAPTATSFVDLGGLRVGAQVRVTADALNIRAGAGTAFDRVALAQIESLWEIIGGPQQAEGYTWWQLQDPADPAQQGWAVEEFLALVEQ